MEAMVEVVGQEGLAKLKTQIAENGGYVQRVISKDYGLSGAKFIVAYEDPRCPHCGTAFPEFDDTAIHLIGTHGVDSEWARLWLRDRVEHKGKVA